MPESGRPTSDIPPERTSLDPPELPDPTVPPVSEQWPPDPMPALEHDLEVLSWLVCSPQLDGEVTGHLCDALAGWALAGRGYPQMALPDDGPDCDHLQALKVISGRISQRVLDADGVALKMDLGRFGRLLIRALLASRDPQAVRDSVERELVAATPWVIGPPAPYRLPGGGVV